MDLDGTLEDSRVDMVAAAGRVRLDLGLSPKGFVELAPHVMRGMEHLYRNCFPERFAADQTPPPAVLSLLAERYEREYSARIAEHTQPYPGISEALDRLASLGAIIVYTNKPGGLSRQLLAELGLLDRVSQVIGCDTYSESKPALGPMLAAAEKSGFHTGQDRSVFVGDSQGDMEAAAAFGARAIWCAWGYYGAPPTNPAPDHVAEQPGDLIAIVEAAFVS